MKLIFRILLFLTSLLVVFLIAGMMLPAQIQIESRVTINATAEKVYAELNDYKAMFAWADWSKIDKNIIYRFEGKSEGVGAIMHWQSQIAEIGKGSQKIIEAEPNTYVKNIIAIMGMPRAYSILRLNERDGLVELNWSFDMQLGYNIPARIKALFMKDDIERHYRQSLDNLKLQFE